MGTIRKRGDYQFQAQVRRAGYPAQSKTFDTRKDAEKWVRAIEREMDTGSFIPRGEAERTTIAKLAERYLEERACDMKGKRQEEQRVNAISKKFGKYHLSAIAPAMIADWIKELGKTRSPQTVQHYAASFGENDYPAPYKPPNAKRSGHAADWTEASPPLQSDTQKDISLVDAPRSRPQRPGAIKGHLRAQAN